MSESPVSDSLRPRRRRRQPAEIVPTEFLPVPPGSHPIRKMIPVREGLTITAIEVAPHADCLALVPGRIYLSRHAGWVRCVEGPRGPYLPARDGQPLIDGGPASAIGYVAAVHTSEAVNVVVPFPTST